MEFTSKKWMLLTGAGFSRNFGGFLAPEMWTRIFNYPDIKGNDALTRLLKNETDFESIYGDVMEKGQPEEKQIMNRAIQSAYKALDDSLQDKADSVAFDITKFWDMLQLFRGPRDEKGILFTLNQDLLMERFSSDYLPIGIRCFPPNSNTPQRGFGVSEFVSLPADLTATKEQFRIWTGLHHIKLHGSYGWKASDGSDQMVIGRNKIERINAEPLLKFYYEEVFTKAISAGDRRLLVIGYGFKDPHINSILITAIFKHGLKIAVIEPSSVDVFKQRLMGGPLPSHQDGALLWEGVIGYFPYTFLELFPRGIASESIEFRELKALIQSGR